MNDRKKLVINKAHQLFIDKGFQATSIQDILEYSGISKGTFYNYFSSKNELLIALFKTVFQQLDKEQNDLLIGQDVSDIEIFIQQIVLQMKTSRKKKLFSLFEEVMVSNDEDLKDFIRHGHLRTLHWFHQRFRDIFDESKKPYLLDCAIMFMGILQNNIKYNYMAQESSASTYRVVRYSVERLVKMVDEVSKSGEQLLQPELLERWLPNCKKTDKAIQYQLYQTVLSLKKLLKHDGEQCKFIELLDFIQDELLELKKPRKFLIESALNALKINESSQWQKELQNLEQLIESIYQQLEK